MSGLSVCVCQVGYALRQFKAFLHQKEAARAMRCPLKSYRCAHLVVLKRTYEYKRATHSKTLGSNAPGLAQLRKLPKEA